MADAATTARRIVEEVLAREGGHDPAAATRSAGTRPPAGRAGGPADVDDATPPHVERVADDTATGGDVLDDRAADDAAALARQIVDEVLAAAPAPDPHVTSPAPLQPDAPATEVGVRGVPRDGIAVEDEHTVHIESVPAPEPDLFPADDPPSDEPSSGPGDDEPPSVPGDDASEIVRRIVAEAQRAQDTPDRSPPDTGGSPNTAPPTAEPGPSGDRGEETRNGPGEPEETLFVRPEHRGAEAGSSPAPHTLDGPPPAPVSTPAQGLDATVVATRSQPAAVAAPPDEELVGWAAVPDRADAPQEATADPTGPRTLRWLLASLLGAVALAVLLPLAVGALRSLVAL